MSLERNSLRSRAPSRSPCGPAPLPQAITRPRFMQADPLRGKFPQARALMDEAGNDVLAFMTFPRAHRTQIYSTNALERLNAEIKRRTNVVGIFPNDAAIVRRVRRRPRPGRAGGEMCPDEYDDASVMPSPIDGIGFVTRMNTKVKPGNSWRY